MSAEDIEYDDFKLFPTRESAIDWLQFYLSTDEINNLIKALSTEPCEDWYDVPSDEMTLGQARRAVKDLRKKLSEHLEQEPILDKIRAEIEQVKSIMNEEIINHDRKDLINFVNGLNQSLVIIDKYKAESEENNGNNTK